MVPGQEREDARRMGGLREGALVKAKGKGPREGAAAWVSTRVTSQGGEAGVVGPRTAGRARGV